jgi:hypothetical protein
MEQNRMHQKRILGGRHFRGAGAWWKPAAAKPPAHKVALKNKKPTRWAVVD